MNHKNKDIQEGTDNKFNKKKYTKLNDYSKLSDGTRKLFEAIKNNKN
ncbi:hypothetical protein H9W90_10200 [Polaribacter pectinis]|uniref:Uncharacterized protein n=1 Tax=Polaribacter pectinis TaxID=2738844 RepID=A0A7G9L7G8_9FLAO|nr:hypothetical protein [Polaribacter pectinis]QNM84567.1 hypothetical protein H9W90_10200 [Polaribacter pectinis]